MDDRATLSLETPPLQPLRLRVTPGGGVIQLSAPNLVLGRHSSADLCLPLPDVSRQHCRFQFVEGEWELSDLGSLNGVFVNGIRIQRTGLHPGDRVRICGVEFEVSPPQSAGPALSVHRLAEALGASNRKSA